MKAAAAARRLALISLCGIALVPLMAPAVAQKPGGSITVGLEFEIPGFDPLKVGVFDTRRKSRRPPSSTRSPISTTSRGSAKLALSWTHSDDFKTWTSSSAGRQIP